MPILTVTLHPSLDRVLRGERLRPNDQMRTQVVLEYAGGKGNNAARALARAGMQVTATGFQGGFSGRIAASKLVAEGVATRFVACQQPTRISTILHEEATGQTYAIYEPGQQVTGDEVETLLDRYRKLVRTHRQVLLCGSAQSHQLQDVFARMIAIAGQNGAQSLLDCSGEALRLGIAARPFLVKVNRQELEEALGWPMDSTGRQVEAMRALCRQGIEIAAITLGSEGLLVANGKETWQGTLAMPVVLNTVGCGDAVLAGLTCALARGASLEEMVRWGTAFGAANTQSYGSGFLDAELLETLRPQVKVERLA